MSNVAFIDSTGVGWLTRLQKKLQAMGRQLVLLDPSPAVKRALSLMRLQDFFASAPDLASARILIQIRILERKQAVSENLTNLLESLVWQGEITVANAEHVWRLTENQITSSSVLAQRLVLDLSHVRFIDSTGLKLMLRARNLVQRRGATLCFAGAQPAVRNVLRLARLESFLLGEPT